ncbi:flagellar basal body P-ring formation chaperone FlgA [bacterium]|nr:flagellar basal body P-ring formation chaperone FlgA [bacterium]
MRFLLSILMLTAGALNSSASAANGALSQGIQDAVQEFLEQEWGKGNVEWVINSVPRVLSDTDAELIKLEAASSPRGTTLIYLSLGEGVEVSRRVPLSIRVMPFAWVPVIREGLKRNDVLGPADLSWERREVTMIRGRWPEMASELPVDSYRARRSLRAGNVLTWHDIEKVPDVLRGAPVTIVSSQGSVEIKLPGKALEDGQKGEMIRVENTQYRRILEARVSGDGVVTLQAASR